MTPRLAVGSCRRGRDGCMEREGEGEGGRQRGRGRGTRREREGGRERERQRDREREGERERERERARKHETNGNLFSGSLAPSLSDCDSLGLSKEEGARDRKRERL